MLIVYRELLPMASLNKCIIDIIYFVIGNLKFEY